MNIEKKGVKDGVHACVLRIFFRFALLLSRLSSMIPYHQNELQLLNTTGFVLFGDNFCCARIDNNRREYFTRRAAQLCNYSCVLRFFFFFLSPLFRSSLFFVKNVDRTSISVYMMTTLHF